jgi:muramoyltetrapeptide carboxypeptidase
VAPAAQLRGSDRNLIEDARKLLESWELEVNVRVDPTHHFYLAGSDDSRAAHLINAIEDPKTRAIFCMRGGYGSSRLWPYLSSAKVAGDKLVIGYSDETALHLAFRNLWPQIQLIHGPNVATHQLIGLEPSQETNRRLLRASLFDPSYEIVEPVEFIRKGSAIGPLIGGCLSVIAASVGTPYALNAAGAVLFLEDAGEAPYRIDRMLTQLQHAGVFDNVYGIIFGCMVRCTDSYNNIKAVIDDVFRSARFPIAFGLQSGHSEINRPLRFGQLARLDHLRSEFILTSAK